MNYKNYNSLDLGKFVAALMVVAIHTHPLEGTIIGDVIRDVFLRLAVPFFFITSSFLFFRKDPVFKDLLHYIKRIMILYAFWAVFSIPLFYVYHTPPYGEPIGFIQLIYNFFLSSTYPGSWFLMASAEAILLVWLLSRRLNNIWVVVVCGVLYVLNEIFIQTNYSFLILVKGNWANASIYFALGKLIADVKSFGNECKCHSRYLQILYLCLAFVFLLDIVSLYVCLSIHKWILVPEAFFVFSIVLKQDTTKTLPYKTLRRMSTMMYLSHFTFVAVVAFVLHHYVGIHAPILLYFIVLLCCFSLYFVMKGLSRHKLFFWLKYGF